jgi:hypothetical protein
MRARPWGAERGQAIAEFALVLPVLLMIAMGLIDLGRMHGTHVALVAAAGEAARYCARLPGDTDGARRRAAAALAGRAALDDELTVCPTVEPGEPVTVTVGTAFTPLTPVISSFTGGTLRLAAPATAPAWPAD